MHCFPRNRAHPCSRAQASTAAYSVLHASGWLYPTDFYHFLLQTLLIALLVGVMGIQLFALYVEHSWRLSAQSRSELDALQARIRPHFLFNSLNTVAELTQQDPTAALAREQEQRSRSL